MNTASVFRRVGIAEGTELEEFSVSDKDGNDAIAWWRGVTQFERNRVVVIV